jgi:hypothetical protein
MKFKKAFTNLMPFFWAILCIATYVYGPGRRSGVHLFPLEEQNMNAIITQIIAINFPILLTDMIKAFAGILLFVLSTVGLGWTFIKSIDRNTISSNHGGGIVISAFMLGQSLFSFFYIFLLIAFRQFSLHSNLIILLCGLIFFLWNFRSINQYIRGGVKGLLSFPNETKVIFPVILSLIILGFALFYSSSRLSYDAASQYYAQAKINALSQQDILLSYTDFFAGSARFLTSIQTALIQLFGDQAARMFSWMNGLAILIFGMVIGKRLGISHRAQLLFLPLALTTTAFVDLLGDGKIDLASTAFALASIYWFLQSIQKPSRLCLFLAGFFGGFAIVVRPYNAILLGVFFLLLILFYLWSAKQRKFFIHSLIHSSQGFLPPILFWVAFYLIINAVVFGDPLAPFSNFNSTINDWPVYLTYEQIIRNVLFYPFVITYHGIFGSFGYLTPFFIAFLPFYFVKKMRTFRVISRELIFICLFAFLILILWITAFNSIFIFEVRYVLFLWILLFLPIAQILDNAMEISLMQLAGVQVILAALLLFMAARTFFISLATYSPIDQSGEPHCNVLPMCTFFNPVNQLANPGDRILVLSAFRYYLRSDLLACSSTRDDYITLEQAAIQSPDKFWEEVQRHGYRYIIFDSFFNEYVLRFHNLPNLSTSIPSNGITIYDRTFKDFDNRTITESVYQIKSSPAITSEKTCVLIDGKWQVQSR